MPIKVQPNFSYTALDGSVLALSESRFDERQRRQRYHLTKGAACWDYGPPKALYRSALPEAARSIARVLDLELAQTCMKVRSNTRWVALADDGWVVRNRSGVPITKPFRDRAQAEVFADLTGSFLKVNVPVLWLNNLPTIKAIPLYGVATENFWLQSDSRPAHMEGKRESRS